ncbi:UDP-4-amino-4,6-dideoxy-N-acetyl-beta-L-altrosamine N-acetyltransferase [Halomonas sp. HP20-15]|uniref:UDP-4-amino-4, 6-dideoxy-N-acetyl-beta-L-altrosamine N-acetyltransferase n=1 Tax=Halomonas sp. HP20-15 TaxID=3085901 RepID=UPI002981DB3F|nr:UDP-4-amino-4,6-dideoxy-N-acetyl-beta-L-altrosamine N-acetyltransferase [Halomonas sp. HP20-15]MDW5378868.1 UDP-4-amino-4,6-dideoxy-N-acetyl-beta-L-altrosamine N-acetyltransferase [Halomonas sp. HP20-15]
MSSSSLRPLRRDDLDCVRAWRNHPEIRRYMYTQHVISAEEHVAWFERARKDPLKHLLLFEIEGVASGFVNISIVDERARRAEWGFYLSPEATHGSGALLGEAALEYAFIKLGLHKLCSEALIDNERSIRFHQKLGFEQESRLRHHHFDGEFYYDVIGFGLLQQDWNSKQGAD